MHFTIFINSKEFNKESKISKEQGRFTERLGSLMITLVKNIINSKRFKIKDSQNEVYYELEMYILENLLNKYLVKYDEKKGSGFALASSIVRNKAYDYLRKLRIYDIIGTPKYQKTKNIFTKKRERIKIMYLDNISTRYKI